MRIEVYADVACPWCYVGEKRLEKALRNRPDLDVERLWRPFQLRPEMPAGGVPWQEFASEKFGGAENMARAFAHVAAAGEPDGLRFDFDRVASAPNTVDAHRLILHAAEGGARWKMADALFRGYFADGRDLNDTEDLAALAGEAGRHGGRPRRVPRRRRRRAGRLGEPADRHGGRPRRRPLLRDRWALRRLRRPARGGLAPDARSHQDGADLLDLAPAPRPAAYDRSAGSLR